VEAVCVAWCDLLEQSGLLALAQFGRWCWRVQFGGAGNLELVPMPSGAVVDAVIGD
jgi:hypothetical protein